MAEPAAQSISAARQRLPLIVSFYAGSRYYRDAAAALRADCERLGVDCDIVEMPVASGETWLDICRKKIPFYQRMLKQHARPVLWMDVDCRLLRIPESLVDARCDIAGFLRGFRYIRGFDSQSVPRFFQPSILYFNDTPRCRAFVDFAALIEAQSDMTASDDYFLQEAWQRFDAELALLLLPPDSVSFQWPTPPGASFYFGQSGQAAAFSGKAVQHVAEALTPARRKAVLLHEAGEALRGQQRVDAIVLLRRAFELDRSDDALAHRLARLLRQDGRHREALLVLRRIEGPAASINHARRLLVDIDLDGGRLDRAALVLRRMGRQSSAEDRDWAAGRSRRLGYDRRAQSLRLKPARRPPLWWPDQPPPARFDDALIPYLADKLSGRPPRFVPRRRALLMAGATAGLATPTNLVWGAGIASRGDEPDLAARFLAVRGPLTRQRVLEAGGRCPAVYGDPTAFLPRLYSPRREAAAPRFRLGWACSLGEVARVPAGEGVRAIALECAGDEDIERLIDALVDCDAVLATSLQAVIACHAYGVPARWARVIAAEDAEHAAYDATPGDDYLLSVGLQPEPPIEIEAGAMLAFDRFDAANRLPRHGVDLAALAAAAPFEIVVSGQRGAGR